MVRGDNSSRTKRARQDTIKPQNEVTVMDQDIWGELPEDLVEFVVARVPIPTFFGFRSVCQKWNGFTESSSFQKYSTEIAPRNYKPMFFGIRCALGTMCGGMYDSNSNKWLNATRLPNISFGYLAASAGGLVCFIDYAAQWIFHVGNPITRAWTSFPLCTTRKPMCPLSGDAAVGMVVSKNQDCSRVPTKGCKIIVLETNGHYKIYDGTSIIPGQLPSTFIMPSILTYRTVTLNGVVYFLGLNPCALMAYNMAIGAWTQTLILAPPNASYLALAESEGRILCVGIVEDDNVSCVSICVWQLHTPLLQWIEIDRMPSSLSSEVYGKDCVYFKCLGNQGLLVMLLRNQHIHRFFSYDPVTRRWAKVPRFMRPGCRRRQNFTTGITFFPCLSVAP